MRARGAVRIAAVVALAAGPFAEPVAAAKLPDWAKGIVEAAPAVPEGVPDRPSRVLFSEFHDEFLPGGELRSRVRYAAQALSVDTGGVDVGTMFFDGNAKLKSSKAWHIAPGERARKSHSDPIDVALNDAFLSDNKVRLLPVEDVEKGSIVLFEFEAEEKPYNLTRMHTFIEDAELKLGRYEVQVPEGWRVDWEWIGSGGSEPEVSGGIWRWEVKEIPAPSREPLAGEPLERVPRLAVNVVPPPGVKVDAGFFGDWAGFSAWYEGIIGDRHAATAQISEVARAAAGASGGDVFSMIRQAGRYVRDKVRYVDIELGIGGMQPHTAAETLSNLYGDCKDKGTLFRSILLAEGRVSYPVLVNSSSRGTVPDSVPAWGFDHYVVAVPLPAEAVIPDDFAPSILEDAELGRLAIVDTTDHRTSVGSISAALAGKRALLVAGDKGHVVTLPGLDPAAHRVERKLTGTLTSAGTLEARRVTRYYGEYARGARAQYAQSSQDRRKAVERDILEIWPDAIFGDYAAEIETADGAFEESIAYELRRLPSASGGFRLGLFPAAEGAVGRVSLRRREVSVEYSFPRTYRLEVAYEGFPESVSVPPGSKADGDGWSVVTAAGLSGGTIRAAFEMTLTRTSFDPGAFEDLRALWSALRTAGAQTLAIPG